MIGLCAGREGQDLWQKFVASQDAKERARPGVFVRATMGRERRREPCRRSQPALSRTVIGTAFGMAHAKLIEGSTKVSGSSGVTGMTAPATSAQSRSLANAKAGFSLGAMPALRRTGLPIAIAFKQVGVRITPVIRATSMGLSLCSIGRCFNLRAGDALFVQRFLS